MLTLRGGLCSLPFLGGIRVAHLLSFLYCVCVFFLSSSYVLCTQCCQFLLIVRSVFSKVCLELCTYQLHYVIGTQMNGVNTLLFTLLLNGV
jgi:hypothetical protein